MQKVKLNTKISHLLNIRTKKKRSLIYKYLVCTDEMIHQYSVSIPYINRARKKIIEVSTAYSLTSKKGSDQFFRARVVFTWWEKKDNKITQKISG